MLVSRREWPLELQRRREAVRAIFEEHDCDSGLIFGAHGHAAPFRYLTNFEPLLGDMWAILGSDSFECVLTFAWQLDEARQRSGIDAWQGQFNPVPLVIEALGANHPRRVALIGLDRLPAPAYEAITNRFSKIPFVDLGDQVAVLRRRKTPLEVGLLKEAARVTDAALDMIRQEIRPGMAEHEVAARLVYEIHSLGADLAFPPCVISGNDDPIPIRQPTGRRFEPGDSIMVDIGAAVDGYQSDVARTFVLGPPNDRQQDVWSTIEAAHQVAVDLARPGVAARELHEAASRVIEEAGYTVAHRVGHGIGLATSFEWPSLDTESALLEPNMTICIEPGIYVSRAGNMKVEDDLVITDAGHEFLTNSSRALEVG